MAGAALAAMVLVGCVGGPAGSPTTSPAGTAFPTQTPMPSPAPTATPTRGPALALPDGMPVHPDATEVASPAGSGAVAAWNVGADPPDVYDFFLRELPAAGFRVDAALPGGDAAIVRFSSPRGAAYQLDLAGHDPVLVLLGAPHD